jgi:YVTN family beta-propeller protein
MKKIVQACLFALVFLLGPGAECACGSIYVANNGSDTVSLYDPATDTVSSTITVGMSPREIALTPDGTRAYVSNQNGDSVSVIDTQTNTVLMTIPLPGAMPVTAVGITASSTRVYVASNSNSEVYVIDIATNTVIATIVLSMGVNPNELAITPDGTELYVVCTGSGTVEVIDIATNMEVISIMAGTTPNGIAFTAVNAYVVNQSSDDVTIIDLATHAAMNVSVAPTISMPQDIAIAPDGTKAYITTIGTDTLFIFDLLTNTVSMTTIPLPVGSSPSLGVFITPDGTTAYVTHTGTNNMTIIDVATNAVIATTGAFFTGPLGLGISCSDLVTGFCSKDIFLTQIDHANTLTWTAVSSAVPISYRVYRGDTLLATVTGTEYRDVKRKKNTTETYSIYSETSNNLTLLGMVTVPPCD